MPLQFHAYLGQKQLGKFLKLKTYTYILETNNNNIIQALLILAHLIFSCVATLYVILFFFVLFFSMSQFSYINQKQSNQT